MTQTIPGSSAARSDTAATQATQELISGGHLVAKALKAEGVDTPAAKVVQIDHAVEPAAYHKRLPGQHSDASPIDPYRLVHEINEFLTEDSIYIGDGGQMLGGYGEEVRDPADIAPALRRARESDLPSLINVWVDPDVYALDHEPDDVQVTAFSAVGRAGI